MPRPWSKRADELFEKEGHYADYAAWREWISDWQEKRNVDLWYVMDGLTTEVAFYSLCCELADGGYFEFSNASGPRAICEAILAVTKMP